MPPPPIITRLIIPNEVASETLTASAGQTIFPFGFAIFDKNDLHVAISGVEIDPTAFTLTGTLLSGGGYQGGNVVLNNAAATGAALNIWRAISPLRATNLYPSASVPVGVIDQSFNRDMALIQDLVARSITIQNGESGFQFPPASRRAGKIILFDNAGAFALSTLNFTVNTSPLSFSTKTLAAATSIPAATAFVVTMGLLAAGDGGDAVWRSVVSAPAHGAYFQSADGVYWEIVPQAQGINIKAVGCRLDAVTNDDTAFDHAVAAAKALGCNAVWVPPGKAILTTSKNFTYAGNDSLSGYKIRGAGSDVSILDFSGMAAVRPAIDFSGNANGVIDGVSIRCLSGSSTCSTLLFCGQNTHVNTGNNVDLRNSSFLMLRSGANAAAVAAVVIASSDLPTIDNCKALGPRGWCMGVTNPGIASDFLGGARAADGDFTTGTIMRSVGVGSSGAAFAFKGGAHIQHFGNYFALEHSGGTDAKGIIEISGSGGQALRGFFRTEDQTLLGGGSGVASVLNLLADSRGHILSGDLQAGANAGAFVFTGAHSVSGNFGIESNAPLLDSNVTIAQSEINSHSIPSLGTPTSAIGLDIRGPGITVAQLIAASAKQWRLWRNDGTCTVSADVQTALPASGALAQPMLFYRRITSGSAAYVAAAEQLINSFTIPKGMAGNLSPISGGNSPGAVFEISGVLVSAAVSGLLRIEATQGGHAIDLINTGASVAAGTLRYRCKGRIFAAGGANTARASTELRIASTWFDNDANLQGATIDPDADDIVINIYWTNTNSASIQLNYIHVWRG